ncbi:MAG: hypothetical protein JO156_10645 [Solirubrobacterales bacterium]|nr:hypothetical protein [Solirubrobacterales bacterium]
MAQDSPNEVADITFSGNAGQVVAVDADNWHDGCQNMALLNPDGSTAWSGGGCSARSTGRIALQQSGTYTFQLVPTDQNTGSIDLTFFDATTTGSYSVVPSASGDTATVSTSPWQVADVSFSGSSGEVVAVDADAWRDGCKNMTLVNPDGTSAWSGGACSSKSSGRISLSQTGTYTFELDPTDQNSGTIAMTVFDVPAASLYTVSPSSSGSAASISTSPWQVAQVNFSGFTGEIVAADADNWQDGCKNMTLVNPDGTSAWSGGACSSKSTGRIALSQTGTYTLRLDPADQNAGTIAMTVFDVPATADYSVVPTPSGGNVRVQTTPWQLARVSFWATAGDPITITEPNWDDGCKNLDLRNPDGSPAWTGGACSSSSTGNVTLQQTGTYTFILTPNDQYSGYIDITATDTGVNAAALAAQFRPYLNFDSSEKWRPLNVEDFLNERDPATGRNWNELCSPTTGCVALMGDSSLQQHPTTDSYISINHDGASDPDSYVSPNPACHQTDVDNYPLHDCDTGPASAIYYHLVGPSPGGYTYIDYWIYYRYNQALGDVGNHAGDWEGITVAPATTGNAIAYVELSDHGSWDSYLPAGLDCGLGISTPGTCSTSSQPLASGLNVDVFPAAGSHANYAQPDSAALNDNPNDGGALWGNNQQASALIPLPATAGEGNLWTSGPENWTDWPGAWGETPEPGTPSGSPCGPAAPPPAAAGDCGADHAGHYYAPWSQTGGNLSCSGADCPQLRRRASGPAPLACSSWFGAGVVAAACDPTPMQNAVRTRRLSSRGSFTITLPSTRRKAATAPGLAQLLGAPLHPGALAIISGVIPRHTQLLVRAVNGRKLITATFLISRQLRGHAVIRVSRGPHGEPIVWLVLRGKKIKPVALQRQTLPAPRRRRARSAF